MKILVADDNNLYQTFLRTTLASWGYEVIVCSDGERCWEELRSSNGPRLAVIDWMMPKMDGIEVCRRVRSGTRSDYVYLILLTGNTEDADLVRALDGGADDFVAKPVQLDELRVRLRSGCRVLEAEERHRLFVENASDGVVVVESSGHVQFVNSTAGAIFGYPAEELRLLTFSELIPGLDERLQETGKKADSSGPVAGVQLWPPIEIMGRHRTGRDVLLEVSCSESVDNARKAIRTVVIRDITQRKSLERQLAQAQKLESIGQLAAGIAHEINTPIQFVGDNGKFLQDAFRDLIHLIPPEPNSAKVPLAQADIDYLRVEVPKAIEQLLEGVEQVARIVRAMKEFSHPGQAQKTLVDINHAIESTIIVSRNEWKYEAELTTDLEKELPPAPCLAGEFNQVILNLIVNAAQALAGTVRASGSKGSIHISTRKHGEHVEIRVRDTGCGIPKEIQSKVFDPFFTTKGIGKGTGQGLAMAHSVIVQKHRGTIRLESEPGLGTTFVIHLPLECELEAA